MWGCKPFTSYDNISGCRSLEVWVQEIKNTRPLSKREKLENDLKEAVRQEDYEKAAAVRDALRNLKTPQSS